MASSEPDNHTSPSDPHGSSVSFVTMGLIVAIGVNVLLGLGILVATHLKSDAIAAEATAGDETLFQCRWMEQGRFVQVEVGAADWQAAEARVCGVDYRDVRLPPLLRRGYAAMLDDPGADPVLQAQRESCSCSDGQMPPVLQDILIEAPRLGTEKKRHALPRIVNNPEKKELNAVAPDIEPKPEPEPEKKDEPEPEKKKKVHKKPDLDELLTAEVKDEARPENQEKQTGTEWGSKHSDSDGAGPEYLQKVKARLDNSMQAPSSIPRTELSKLNGKITIKVGANGRVWDWSWRSRSGNTAFDTMIERTLKRFEIGGDLSFPAPPDDWVMKSIRISIDGSRVR